MNKIEFLAAVSAALGALPPEEIKGHINFLSEMIDDRVEEGLTEAEAIAAMGNPDHVASAILSDTPITAEAAPQKPRARRGWRTALVAATSPIWASLLLAATITLFCLVVTLAVVGVGLGAVALPCWLGAKYLYVYSMRGAKRILRR